MVANTKEEIEKSLDSLESFNAMLHQRHVNYYDNKIQQDEFLVLGTFYLDACGNCMQADSVIPGIAAKVLTKEEMQTHENCKRTSFGMPDRIPPSRKICPICKKEWAMDNFLEAMRITDSITVSLEDFVGKTLKEVREFYNKKSEARYFGCNELMIRNDKFITLTNEHGWIEKGTIDENYTIQAGDGTYFNVHGFLHKKCYAIKRESEQLERFKELFKKAGFDLCTFKPIPNQYCDCDRCTAWYEVQTPKCDFVIGDRKRVTNISWTARINGEKLFKGEDVTMGTSYIHAWSDEKVVEYLTKIKLEL